MKRWSAFFSFLLLIMIGSCSSGEDVDPEPLFQECKVESHEVYYKGELELKRAFEYDGDLNPVRMVFWQDFLDGNTRFEKELYYYSKDKQLERKEILWGETESSVKPLWEETYFYDDQGRLDYTRRIFLPDGEEWKNNEYEYYSNGVLKKSVHYNSNGSIYITEEYNILGQVVMSVTDGNLTITYKYDSRGNITRYEVWWDGEVVRSTEKAFNLRGDIIKLKEMVPMLPEGNFQYMETDYFYNSDHKLVKEEYKDTNTLSSDDVYTYRKEYEYDEQGFLEKVSTYHGEKLVFDELLKNDAQGREVKREKYRSDSAVPELVEETTTSYWGSGNIREKRILELPLEEEILRYDEMGNQILRSRSDYDGIEFDKVVNTYVCR